MPETKMKVKMETACSERCRTEVKNNIAGNWGGWPLGRHRWRVSVAGQPT
jgi:hypothetical protein